MIYIVWMKKIQKDCKYIMKNVSALLILKNLPNYYFKFRRTQTQFKK